MIRILITIIFILVHSIGFSQMFKDPKNIFPYAPETSSLVKYQETPVSNYTGVPNISIPIYTVKSGSLEIPITLNYHSGGILVSEIAGPTGLGWSINTITPITRKINGYTDENGVMEHDDNIEGFLNSGIDNQQLRLIMANNGGYNASISDLMSDEFSLSIDKFFGSFFYNPKNKKLITFPMSDLKIDYYTKIFGSNKKQIDTINVTTGTGLKYTFGGDGTETFTYTGDMLGSNYFGATTWKIKKIKSTDNSSINFSYTTNDILKKELAPQSKSIPYSSKSFTTGCNTPDPYNPGATIPSRDIQYSMTESLLNKIETQDAVINFVYSGRLDFNDLKKLDKIVIKDKSGKTISEKKFNYGYFEAITEASGASDYTEDPTKRLKLLSYEECDREGKCIATKFEYYEDKKMAQRLSYSTDHWGYFNGTVNNYGFPNVPIIYLNTLTMGAILGFVDDLGSNYIRKANKDVNPEYVKTYSLKSIIYPEGGKNEYIYEPNTASSLLYQPIEEHYFLTKRKNLQKSSSFKVSGYAEGPNLITDDPAAPTTSDGMGTKTYVWEVDLTNYYKNGSLNIYYSSNFKSSTFSNFLSESSIKAELSLFYYENGVKKYIFMDSPMGDGQSINLHQFNNSNIPNLKVYAQIKHIYWGGLSWGSNLTDNKIFFYSQINFNWDEINPEVNQPIITGGGIRIKEIKQYDNNGLYKYSTKYAYTKDNNPQLSSGILFNIPMYTRTNRIGEIRSYNCSSGGSGVTKLIQDATFISITPVTSGMRTQGKTIGYTNVEVVKIDAANNINGKEIFQYYTEPPFGTGNNSLASVESTSARYEFMETRDWRNGELLKYIALNSNNDTVKTVKRNFYLAGPPKATSDYYQERNVKMLLYNLISPIDYQPGGTPLRNVFSGASMMDPNVSINGIFPSAIGLNTTTQPGYFPIFIRHNDSFLLNKEITTDYFDGGKKKSITTEYFYDEPLFPTRLTAKKVSFSNGKKINKTIKYAHNKGNQLMIDKNMIEIPLEIETTQTINATSKILSKEETIYPVSLPTAQAQNMLVPLSIKSYDILNGGSYNEVSYDKYDEKGNIVQYTTKEGIPVSIVWGYNKTQPIAKIEGVTYDQVIATNSVSNIVSKSDEDAADSSNEELFLEALNYFRKQPEFLGKQITTFTYDPLIGMTSITPPSGIRKVYTYDAANRLNEVKIREKDSTTGAFILKTIKQFKYNHKK